MLLTRDGFESVADWSTATLADLFEAASEDLGGHVYVEPEVAALPDYQAADRRRPEPLSPRAGSEGR